jgi:hypothetical protein
MPVSIADPHLIAHLQRHCALTENEVSRLIEEITAYYHETPHGYIRRRHIELQRSGMTNAEIYTQILEELPNHRFISEPMTARQIRRAIYG